MKKLPFFCFVVLLGLTMCTKKKPTLETEKKAAVSAEVKPKPMVQAPLEVRLMIPPVTSLEILATLTFVNTSNQPVTLPAHQVVANGQLIENLFEIRSLPDQRQLVFKVESAKHTPVPAVTIAPGSSYKSTFPIHQAYQFFQDTQNYSIQYVLRGMTGYPNNTLRSNTFTIAYPPKKK